MSAISAEHQLWIAENLAAGCSDEQLMPNLLASGYTAADIEKELHVAKNHPYVQGATKIHNRLKRRESLLKTLDLQLQRTPGYLQVEKVPLPPFQDFLRDYYYANRVGFFSGAMAGWPALQWSPRAIAKKVGENSMVEVQFNRSRDKLYELNSSIYKRQMTIGEFVDLVESTDASNDFYMTANNYVMESSDMKILLKDIGKVGDGYLNDTDISRKIFFWMGPKGTITPLHHDLTNNLFLQIYGTKTFRMIPSMQIPYLYNYQHVYSDVDLLEPDYTRFPEFSKITPLTFEVTAGDCLFIPAGWAHHVVGDTISISMTFNNFDVDNGHNGFIDYPHGVRY